MRLYGKDRLKERLDGIAANDRLSHAILFSGNAGCGRKTLARYAAQLILCDNHACGQCVTCRNIERDGHPDVIFVKRENGGKYSVEMIREILRDAPVLPNNGDEKIYVFEDIDTMLLQHHNTLLKLIEEPPAHLRFIFTCENTGVVPETVMSRITEFEVPDMSAEDCCKCLIDSGADPAKARELSELFSGNVGKCRAALAEADDPELKLAQTARRAAAAIAKRDELGAVLVLSENSDREDFSVVMEYLSRIFRDALALKHGGDMEFFGKEEAQKLAASFSESEFLNMLSVVFEIEKNSVYNLNIAVTVSYFMTKIL